jgi:hypothetical protein
MNRRRIEHNASIRGWQAELGRLETQKQRIVDAVKDGYATPDMKDELNANYARRQ